jgi:hypothetical protein
MKVDRAAQPIQHRRFQIVVHKRAGAAAVGREGLDVPAQETLEALIQRKDRVQRARVAQHQHQGGERPRPAADADRSEVAPVDLRDFAGQRGQPQIGLAGRRGAQVAHRPSDPG